jgi:DNA-binding transcriptional LysR family regulator
MGSSKAGHAVPAEADFILYSRCSLQEPCAEALFSSPYVFLLADGHPLSAKASLSLEELDADLSLLVYDRSPAESPEGASLRQALPQAYAFMRSFESIRSLLSDASYVALVPAVFFDERFYAFNRDLCILPCTGLNLWFNAYAAGTEQRQDSSLHDEWQAFLQEYPFKN